ncbi:hypothetical protein [Achromobacter mucicolens]|uniref:hypothetical protein n=1 Tax=Achromobacter mucicolens TaxID=1389922 RepID=UPI0015832C89|nr:hypothetical protein [Achromobacter mucicolens]
MMTGAAAVGAFAAEHGTLATVATSGMQLALMGPAQVVKTALVDSVIDHAIGDYKAQLDSYIHERATSFIEQQWGFSPDEAGFLAYGATFAGQLVLDSARNALSTAKNLNNLISGEKGLVGELYYKKNWSQAQRAEADAKVAVLNQSRLAVSQPDRSKTRVTMNEFRNATSMPQGRDVDHIVYLQLGGGKAVDNLWSLDASVNRSLGVQIHHEIKNLPLGTVIEGFIIKDR